MPYILALYAKQFLEIKLFTFDYQENKSQRTVDKVPMCLPELSFKKLFRQDLILAQKLHMTS